MDKEFPAYRLFSHSPMTKSERKKLGDFIEKTFGIRIPETKKTLLEGRLAKRLRLLRLKSFEEYYKHLLHHEHGTAEIIEMINEVSTNKTDFFREPKHFEYLKKSILPELFAQNIETKIPLRIWSAGSSSGEEPYSIAMVIESFIEQYKPTDYKYKILATDIAARVLKKGELGIYSDKALAPLPKAYIKKYTMRNKDPQKPISRIVPEIRQKINFKKLNLIDLINEQYNFNYKYHIIFCRNVFIYFDKKIKNKIINKFINSLEPGGYLFIGHSETLMDLNGNLQTIQPAIYKKTKPRSFT